MYKVIKEFTDLQDDCHRYAVGDDFPRAGYDVTEARIAQLAGNDNRQKTPLIAKQIRLDSISPVSPVQPDSGAGQEAPFMNEPKEPVIETQEPKRVRRGRKNKEI